MCAAGKVLGCDDYREMAAKPTRCLWFSGSCLSLLFAYEGHVLNGYVVFDQVARPKCTNPVVGNP